jgi:hypothetical protein
MARPELGEPAFKTHQLLLEKHHPRDSFLQCLVVPQLLQFSGKFERGTP